MIARMNWPVESYSSTSADAKSTTNKSPLRFVAVPTIGWYGWLGVPVISFRFTYGTEAVKLAGDPLASYLKSPSVEVGKVEVTVGRFAGCVDGDPGSVLHSLEGQLVDV